MDGVQQVFVVGLVPVTSFHALMNSTEKMSPVMAAAAAAMVAAAAAVAAAPKLTRHTNFHIPPSPIQMVVTVTQTVLRGCARSMIIRRRTSAARGGAARHGFQAQTVKAGLQKLYA